MQENVACDLLLSGNLGFYVVAEGEQDKKGAAGELPRVTIELVGVLVGGTATQTNTAGTSSSGIAKVSDGSASNSDSDSDSDSYTTVTVTAIATAQ